MPTIAPHLFKARCLKCKLMGYCVVEDWFALCSAEGWFMGIAMLADGCSWGQAAGGVSKQKAAQCPCRCVWLPLLFFFTFFFLSRESKVWPHTLVEPHPASHSLDYTHSHSDGVKHKTFFSVYSCRPAPLEQLTRSGALPKGTLIVFKRR